MPEVTLHIGAAKCGSSAIQTVLSNHPRFQKRDGSKVEYLSIKRNGTVLRGKTLSGSIGTHGYLISPVTSDFRKLDLAELTKSILSSDASHIIISNEEWMDQAATWAKIIPALGIRTNVVAYVRPQVPFLNSAWWQWGAWSGLRFEDWALPRMRASARWAAKLVAWKAIPEIGQVTVRLLPKDIVADFFEKVLDAPVPADITRVANRGLPATFLRLMQRNRELRPGIHDSRIDFLLSKHLDLHGSPPWVIDNATAEAVIRESRNGNLKLLDLLDGESAETMRNDLAWWDVHAFEDKTPETPGPAPIPQDALEQLCVELTKAVKQLSQADTSKNLANSSCRDSCVDAPGDASA